MHVSDMEQRASLPAAGGNQLAPPPPNQVMAHHIHRRMAHVFNPELSGPLKRLQSLEVQDTALVSAEALISCSIWSTKLLARPPRWVDCTRP